jgi:hypothetical protein
MIDGALMQKQKVMFWKSCNLGLGFRVVDVCLN